VNFVCADADLCAEAETEAVAETGAAVDKNVGGIEEGGERVGGTFVSGNNCICVV